MIIVPLTIFPLCLLLLVPQTASSVSWCAFFCFFRLIDRFFAVSGVNLVESNKQFHYRHVVFSSQIKSKVGHILVKFAALSINLTID